MGKRKEKKDRGRGVVKRGSKDHSRGRSVARRGGKRMYDEG